jgi:hypothetical protein
MVRQLGGRRRGRWWIGRWWIGRWWYAHNTSHIPLAEVRGTVTLGVLVYNGKGDGETDDWRFTEVYATPSGC